MIKIQYKYLLGIFTKWIIILSKDSPYPDQLENALERFAELTSSDFSFTDTHEKITEVESILKCEVWLYGYFMRMVQFQESSAQWSIDANELAGKIADEVCQP